MHTSVRSNCVFILNSNPDPPPALITQLREEAAERQAAGPGIGFCTRRSCQSVSNLSHLQEVSGIASGLSPTPVVSRETVTLNRGNTATQNKYKTQKNTT